MKAFRYLALIVALAIPGAALASHLSADCCEPGAACCDAGCPLCAHHTR